MYSCENYFSSTVALHLEALTRRTSGLFALDFDATLENYSIDDQYEFLKIL